MFCGKNKDIIIKKSFEISNWSVGPRRPSDKSDAIVAGWLAGYLSMGVFFWNFGIF